MGKYHYFPNNSKGETEYNFNDLEGKEWFIHEMTHVYQYQKSGWGYAPKSVWERITKGEDAYNYEKDLSADKDFSDYSIEQQASMVKDYFRYIKGMDKVSTIPKNQAATPSLAYTIYFPGYGPNNPDNRAVLMHELTHIYQKDNYPFGKLGALYSAIEDMIKRLRGKDSWDYNIRDLKERPFSKFSRDQQAMIVQNYYELSSNLDKLKPEDKDKLNTIILRLREAGLLL